MRRADLALIMAGGATAAGNPAAVTLLMTQHYGAMLQRNPVYADVTES